jgi:hypothetical protein
MRLLVGVTLLAQPFAFCSARGEVLRLERLFGRGGCAGGPMCVCVCVCVCVCMCVCMYAFMYVYMQVYTYVTCTYVCNIRVYVCVCLFV